MYSNRSTSAIGLSLLGAAVVVVVVAWSGPAGVAGQQECLDVAEVLLQCSGYMQLGRSGMGSAAGASPSLRCCNELQGLSFVGAIGDGHRICKCMQAMVPNMGDLDPNHVVALFATCDAQFNFDLSPFGSMTCP